MSILVYHNGALGDFVLFLPALRLIRNHRPSHHLCLFTRPSFADLAVTMDLADESRDAGSPHLTSLYEGRPAPETLEFLRRFDRAFLVTSSPALVTSCRAGVRGPVTVHAPLPQEAIPVARHHLAGLRAAFPSLPPSGHQDLEPLRPLPQGSSRLSPPAPWVMLHPGSGSDLKNLPTGTYAATALALRDLGYGIVWSFGPADTAVRQRLTAQLPAGDIVADSLSPSELLGLLKEAAAYVGGDSGVSHLAGASGTPAVVIFGPTDDRRWRPWGPGVLVLAHRTPCARCPGATLRASTSPACDRLTAGVPACLAEMSSRDIVEGVQSALDLLVPPTSGR